MSAEERAERLGVTMLLFGLVREPARDALQGSKDTELLTHEEVEAWRSSDDEDLRLGQACIEAEFELRDHQWQALELLDYAYNEPPSSEAPRSGAGAAYAAGDRADLVPVRRADLARLARFALGWSGA
jgi:hypothetical protein